MAINVTLALDGVDFNKINLTLVDGLSIDKLKIRYNWIFNAVIDNAVIGEDSYGLVWYSGTWLNGEWYDGTWYSGKFLAGVWKNGNFYSYKLNKYDIVNGVLNIIDKNDTYSTIGSTDPANAGGVTWDKGNFYGGTFGQAPNIFWTNYTSYNPNNPLESNDITNNIMNTAVWKSGNFYGGIFYNSIWYDGNWYGGYMDNIQWINGKFYNGKFNGYVWYDGVFLGGDFLKGTWYNGTFTMFDATVKSRFGVTTDRNPAVSRFNPVTGVTSDTYPTVVEKNQNDANKKAWVDDVYTIQSKMTTPLSAATFTEIQISKLEQISTNMLTFRGFNFNIPENSTINGIEVQLSIYNSGGTSIGDYVKMEYIGLSDSADLVGYTNMATSFEFPTGSTPYVYTATYGSSTETWGNTWSAANINNTEVFSLNFNLLLYKYTDLTDVGAYLAGVKMVIHYKYEKPIYDYALCKWKNGVFNNGEFHSGLYLDANGNSTKSENQSYSVWYDGTFNNGKWYGGNFQSGTWNNGSFYAGFFGGGNTDPIWNAGFWYNGYWISGSFNGGEFHSGMAKNIIITGGQVGD